MLRLIIGNKNYSSWSLRAWLHLRESGIEFVEERLSLFSGPGDRDALKPYSPAGRVPVLVDGELAVWDSLAIHEYLAENHEAIGWPRPRAARARARSIACELHSGFMALRGELPQNVRAHRPLEREALSDACRAQVDRVEAIFAAADGEGLFGELSIADFVFAPVALRFVTYAIELEPRAAGYVERIRRLDGVRRWVADSAEEPERLDFVDRLLPVDRTPIDLG